MGLFKKNESEPSKKGLQVQVNHKLIDENQTEAFTHMVKETVKILAIGIVVTTASALALKFGADYLTDKLIQP